MFAFHSKGVRTADCSGAGPSEDNIQTIISELTDAELAALEDELNFCSFAGIPSARMLKIMDRAGVLDPAWRELLDESYSPDIPAPTRFTPVVSRQRHEEIRRMTSVLLELPETA